MYSTPAKCQALIHSQQHHAPYKTLTFIDCHGDGLVEELWVWGFLELAAVHVVADDVGVRVGVDGKKGLHGILHPWERYHLLVALSSASESLIIKMHNKLNALLTP